MLSREAREAFAVLVGAIALAILLTYPLAFRIDRLGRVNTDDGRLSIWNVAWVAHILTTQPRNLYHANIFYPHPYALAYSEANIGAGVLGIPAWLATRNAYTTHNTVVLATFVLSFAGMYYLARHLSGHRLASAVAGILFAFCPFIYARTAHIQLMFIGWLPVALLAFHRLVDRATLGRSVALGLALWATALSCAYYGIFAALMVGVGTAVFGVSRALWRSRDHVIGILLAAVVSIGLTLPFFLPYLYIRRQGFGRDLDEARHYSANLGAWFASPTWAHRWWLEWLPGFSEVLFPGLLAIALGLPGIVIFMRRRRDVAVFYLLIGLVALWASLGPAAGLYTVLYNTLPIFAFLRAPARLGILVTLVLVVFAAVAIAHLLSRAPRPAVIAGVLGLAAVAELSSMPLTQFRTVEPVSVVYRTLAHLPHGAVVELPYWSRRSDYPRHAYYMLNSTAHWQPLVNGYSDHIPDDFRKNAEHIETFPSRSAFFALARAGARYVVVHLDLFHHRQRERVKTRLELYSEFLRPIARDEHRLLFEIVAFPN